MQPPSRYVEVLDHLRPGHPERVLFVFLGGIAPGLTDRFSRDLGSCRLGDYPRRIVDFARQLDGRALGGSLCELGDAEVTDEITRRIAEVACE